MQADHQQINSLIKGLRQGSKYWDAIPLPKLEEGKNTFEYTTIEGIKLVIPLRHPDSLTREYKGQAVYWRFLMLVDEGELLMTEKEFIWAKIQMIQQDLCCVRCFDSPAGNMPATCEGGQCAFGKLMRGKAAVFEMVDETWRRRSVWRVQHEQAALELGKVCKLVKFESIVPV